MNTQTLTINKTSIEQRIKDVIVILALWIFTIFMVYFMPRSVGRLFVFYIVIAFFISKKNYFWLAYFFILLVDPGNFFFNNYLDAPYRLPIFTLVRGVSLSTSEVFMIAAFIKAIISRYRYRYILSKPLLLLFIYSIFLICLSLVIYGTSFENFTYFIRLISFYSYFISFAFLIKKWEDVVKFFYLLFPFIFMVFLFGIYFYMTGNYFVQLLNPGPLNPIFFIKLGIVGRWNGTGAEILLVGLIASFSLFILSKKRNNYLLSVGIISYFTILLTGTRIWFVVFTLIILAFLFKSKRLLKKIIIPFSIIAIIIFVFINFNPRVSTGFSQSTERISTIFEIGVEDSSSTVALQSKIEKRLPKVLKAIEENPIVGWGFSDRSRESLDSDVGNFSLIAQVGFFGFILFLYFWGKYIRLILKIRRFFSKDSHYRKVLLIFIIAFLGFLIAHFTTHQFFGLTLLNQTVYFNCIFIFMSESFIRFSLKQKTRIKVSKE